MSLSEVTRFSEQIADRGYWLGNVTDWGVPETLTSELFALAQNLRQQGNFQLAQVGKGVQKQLATWIRRDEIHWLTQWQSPPLSVMEGLLREIQALTRRELFLPIKRFEGHFSLYPEGAFYRAHVDRHRRLPSRLLTLVLYLNDMGEQGGGELRLFPKGREAELVCPQAGRLIVFDSRIRHEVCPTRTERWSLTAWFRNDEIVGIEGL